ncbi:MAG: tRNA (adenosine(37)-N6)-threonylcarbamoyltransferase complex dimerization subunit type 1 TsaB [Dehalococcoidia bacterium]|nr:tRNA (adenosine(37)-N6)-threonylcarbamoyltransferase complex dimerization subunit type 1 TsaB [Dehalococcoidia bacterium]
MAIDTSTRIASVALFDGCDVAAEITWQSEMNHTVELFPAIQHIMALAMIGMPDLTRLVVAIGPGSFNGLRVGLSAAKALSFGLRLPLVGISTLETQAYQHFWFDGPVCSLLRAGREEIFAALFQRQDGAWRRLVDEHITTPQLLCDRVGGESIFTGEIDIRLASEVMACWGPTAIIPPAEARLRRAGFLAALGWRRHEAGLAVDPATLQPLYLRRPPITMRKKP